MKASSRRASYAAEHRHWRDRLLRLYADADDQTKADGRDWYPLAEILVGELSAHYEKQRQVIAGMVAAMSPQTRWRENVANVEALLEGRPLPSPGYLANQLKAEAIMAGAPPLDVLGGDKVRAFYANLIGDQETVTIDVWAQRAATGKDLRHPRDTRYKRLARAYQAAAWAVGEQPRAFQAIAWLYIRPSNEHVRDTVELFA